MSKELIISTKDFNEVGINAQLSVNDLVEVVANDIYEKFIVTMEESISHSKDLIKKWQCLFENELEVMRQQLIKSKLLLESEDIYKGYRSDKKIWDGRKYVNFFEMEERDKGIKVTTTNKYFTYPVGYREKSKVRLEISVNDYEFDKKINEAGITGYIETRISKKFNKVILVSGKKFSELLRLTDENNERVEELKRTLPKGLLSVERFTREARVKMNKKIISSQSPDFRNKMSELFKIKL